MAPTNNRGDQRLGGGGSFRGPPRPAPTGSQGKGGPFEAGSASPLRDWLSFYLRFVTHVTPQRGFRVGGDKYNHHSTCLLPIHLTSTLTGN